MGKELTFASDDSQAFCKKGQAGAYASGTKVFRWKPVNGFRWDADVNKYVASEGFLTFGQVNSKGDLMGDKNLLYWSSLSDEPETAKLVDDKVVTGKLEQNDFGKKLGEKLEGSFSVKDAKLLMLSTLQEFFKVGEPKKYLILTIDATRYHTHVGYKDGTAVLDPHRHVKITGARFSDVPTTVASTTSSDND